MSKRNKLSKMENSLADMFFEEKWKQIIIEGMEMPYEVSTFGNVRRIGSSVPLKLRKRGGKTKDNQYRSVFLSKDGKGKSYSVHRLVATAFIPNPENKTQVNHIDGVKYHNNVENLEWSTASENVHHAIDNGLMVYKRGVEARNAKNSEEDVHNVCKLLARGFTLRDTAKRCGVTYAFVAGVRYRDSWKAIRSQYPLPKTAPCQIRDSAQIEAIDNMIKSGNHNRRDILKQVGLPYTSTNVSYVKYRYRKLYHPETLAKYNKSGNSAS